MNLDTLIKDRPSKFDIYGVGLPKVKIKSVQDFVTPQKPKIEEKHNLNYSIVTTINIEVSATLLFLSEKGLISEKDLVYFEKMASEDYNHLCGLYKKHGKEDLVIGEYELLKNLFANYAKRSLSEFQRQSEPLLVDILATIYAIEYITIAIPKIIKVIGRIPERNTFRIIEEKREELKALFLKLYYPLTNYKTFDFGRFTKTFQNITEMDHNEFKQYIKQWK